MERRADPGYTLAVDEKDRSEIPRDADSNWEATEAMLRARRIGDRRRLVTGEATAAEINAVNYAWPDPALCRTIEGHQDFSCLDLESD